jgi:hypothetical protein
VASILGYIEIYESVDNRDDRYKVTVVARRKQEKRWS